MVIAAAPTWPAPPCTHPPGPVGHLRCPPWCRPPLFAASWPIRARFQSFSLKVSQNREVSPKKCQKASHSPYLQNSSQKSPLDFLRFLFSSAFSPKELMGLFWPEVEVYCQNDEVSPVVHTYVPRSVRQIPPRTSGSKLPPGGPLLIWLGATSWRYSQRPGF